MGQSLPVWLRGHSPSQTQAQLERLHRCLDNTYYEVEGQAVRVEFHYPFAYDFYPLEVPYQYLRRRFPRTTQLLLRFLILAQGRGVTFWWDSYAMFTTVEAIVDGYFEEHYEQGEERQQAEAYAQESKALRDAVVALQAQQDSTARLGKDLLKAAPAEQEARALRQVLHHWLPLLDEADHINDYRDEQDEGDGSVMLPNERFIVVAPECEAVSELHYYSVSECTLSELTHCYEVRGWEASGSIPTFPMRFERMFHQVINHLNAISDD